MEAIINGKRYSTEAGTLLASDRYWDGHNFERSGRNCYLYKTTKGAFFVHRTTRWEGERDTLEALGHEEALRMYEELPEKESSFLESFGVEPEDA
jgi:hypothetical protein